MTLFVGLALVPQDQRILRNWHDRTGLGDPTHRLLTVDEEAVGTTELTSRQALSTDRPSAVAA